MSGANPKNVLVTGSTGYVGGRMVNRLLDKGYNVRCLVRDTSRIEGRGWDAVTVVEGDVLKYESILPAMDNIYAAYYLVHSMGEGKGFHERDLKGAENFGRAARERGLKRIIYMSGLGSETDKLSPHLLSRHATGNALRQSGVPVTEFRAAQIIGSGSVSFEMIRYITERMPIIVGPKFVKTFSQPIAVRDVLRYLVDCLEVPESAGRILEIGGPDILGYDEMMLTYARLRGLRRRVLAVPFLTPEICAYFLDLFTPIPANIGRPLIYGLRNEVVVRDDTARKLFDFTPIRYEHAIQLAIERNAEDKVETIWSGSVASVGAVNEPVIKLTNVEGMVAEERKVIIEASAANAFKAVVSIGGHNGWLYANPLWWSRAFLDRIFGGVGRRGRRCYLDLRVGDPVDFWRVEDIRHFGNNYLLRLRSEMKMPGKGWLQFEISPLEGSKVLLTQIAFYEPRGLMGHLYWYALYPVHKFIFSGMIQVLAKQIQQIEDVQKVSAQVPPKK